jgi:hypothetical protein
MKPPQKKHRDGIFQQTERLLSDRSLVIYSSISSHLIPAAGSFIIKKPKNKHEFKFRESHGGIYKCDLFKDFSF